MATSQTPCHHPILDHLGSDDLQKVVDDHNADTAPEDFRLLCLAALKNFVVRKESVMVTGRFQVGLNRGP